MYFVEKPERVFYRISVLGFSADTYQQRGSQDIDDFF
jgi:hypothetical protein